MAFIRYVYIKHQGGGGGENKEVKAFNLFGLVH